jgi:hypothetical protein
VNATLWFGRLLRFQEVLSSLCPGRAFGSQVGSSRELFTLGEAVRGAPISPNVRLRRSPLVELAGGGGEGTGMLRRIKGAARR